MRDRRLYKNVKKYIDHYVFVIKRKIDELILRERADSISLTWLILFLGLALIYFFYHTFPTLQGDAGSYSSGVLVEATGALFDVFIFGIILAYFARRLIKRQEIERQQEIINDFKKWKSQEGNLRIAGAIRRLIKLGKTDIDLRGIELKQFSFKHNDIKELSGSIFHDGSWGDSSSISTTVLEKVSFDDINLTEVQFCPHSPFGGLGGLMKPQLTKLLDCSFIKSTIAGASFSGAYLEWSAENPVELYVQVDEEVDGQPIYARGRYATFEDVDFEGVSFKYATFKNADFRNVYNLDKADFTGALGLDTCFFDDDEIKDKVLLKV